MIEYDVPHKYSTKYVFAAIVDKVSRTRAIVRIPPLAIAIQFNASTVEAHSPSSRSRPCRTIYLAAIRAPPVTTYCRHACRARLHQQLALLDPYTWQHPNHPLSYEDVKRCVNDYVLHISPGRGRVSPRDFPTQRLNCLTILLIGPLLMGALHTTYCPHGAVGRVHERNADKSYILAPRHRSESTLVRIRYASTYVSLPSLS